MIGVCMFDEWGPCSIQRVGLEFESTFGFAVSVGCVCVCVFGAYRGPMLLDWGSAFRASGLWLGFGLLFRIGISMFLKYWARLEFDSNSHAVEAGD